VNKESWSSKVAQRSRFTLKKKTGNGLVSGGSFASLRL
jgi:hypothetical protein